MANKQEKNVYLVYRDEVPLLPLTPECVFDSIEEAESYTKRFKASPRYELLEVPLNPMYDRDSDRTPYRVSFRNDRSVSIYVLFEHEDGPINDYIEKRYDFDRECISAYILAKDESQALEMALKIRDEVLATGMWDYKDDNGHDDD